MEEICAITFKATGKTVVYKQVPVKDSKKELSFEADMFTEHFSYLEEFGYLSPESEELIAWAAENPRDRSSTLEEYMQSHSVRLE